MPLKYNLTFALLTYWSDGSYWWEQVLRDEILWANVNLKMTVLEFDYAAE
jgi:hypothetical protein